MSSHEITASWDRLFIESRENADARLHHALQATKDLPPGLDRTALIVAHMQAGQGEFLSTCIGVAAQKLASAVERLAVVVEGLGDE